MTQRKKIAKIVERGTSAYVEWWHAGERRRTRSINKHEGGYSRALRVVAEIEEVGGDIDPADAVARTFPAKSEDAASDDAPSPFGLWIDLWRTKNRAPEEETRRNYDNQIARLAQWRDVDVRTWDDDTSQDVLDGLEQGTATTRAYASSTADKTFQRVSGALALAVEAGVLAKLPRQPVGTEYETPGIELDDDQLDAILHASDPCPDLRDMVALMIETGMRIGEVCAIQPEHLARRSGTLKVRQTVKHDKSVGKVKNGKNGRRDVVIDPELTSELWQMLLRRADAVPADGFLFHRKSGVGNSPRDTRRPALPTTVRGQWATWVRPLAARQIVPASVRIHDLRHTAGSMLAADPMIPPLAASERLGMSLKTYERTYAHTLAHTRNAMGAKMRGWSERAAERASVARRQSIHAI